jgi:histidinol-phosphate phosphatase family protein
MDLEKDLLFGLCGENGSVYAYLSTEYIKDVGTPDRLEQATWHMEKGLVADRNLSLPQKCIFLDRDGVLNKYAGLISSPMQLELEDTAVEAVSEINDSGYLAIVITNQPVVARGLCTIDEVNEIHKKLQTLLGREHVYVDDIFFCPHHPDKGYPEENTDYKIICNCRKPKTGMITAAVERYNIDICSSWFIGDTTTDIMTGRNTGLKTILVKTGEAGTDKKHEISPDFIADNLLEAVKLIIYGEAS